MSASRGLKPIEILLVDDSAGDVRLAIEALKESRVTNRVNAVSDGVEAMAYLHREGKYRDQPCPDLILLDLNLPRKDGRETLAEIKQDQALKSIPIVILTVSSADEDIIKAYNLYANCYITKPIDLTQFTRIVNAIDDFWFTVVKLPPKIG
jgi:chemotaxis family two-component system response regulator Rcp1